MPSSRSRLTQGRVVVKVGSSSVTAAGGVDAARVDALVEVLAGRVGRGQEIILVSSGAIAAGLAPLGVTGRPRDLATAQAAASVGQGILMAQYADAFARRGQVVGQVLLTTADMIHRRHYHNARNTLDRLLRLGAMPIVNENDTVVTDEIRFGDNDRLAALVAHLVHADFLLLLSDVDALYDGPPSRAGARPITSVTGQDDLVGVTIGSVGDAGVGTGGMATKVKAATIATASGIPTLLTSAELVGQAFEPRGKEVGTWFEATGKRLPTRILWLEHVAEPAGRLYLDDGAVLAVTRRGASLLPAGVVDIRGTFDQGDPVDLCDATGHPVARGLVNYPSGVVPDLLGRSTGDLAAELGGGFGREIVHRDALAVLDHPY